MENNRDIIDEYFACMSMCSNIACKKVIFEPESKIEWFFYEDCWCYFEFYCDDEYVLRKVLEKNFSKNCMIRDMSYEIKMLLAFVLLRGVVTVEKDLFLQYVDGFENFREKNKDISIEQYNIELKEKEKIALIGSEKIVNIIMFGCLTLVAAVVLLFVLAIISYLKMHYFS